MFLRAQPQSVDASGAQAIGQAAAARVRDHTHNVLDELERAATRSSETAKQAVTGALTSLSTDANSAVQQFKNELTTAKGLDGSTLCDQLAAGAGNQLDRASTALTPQWNSLVASLTNDFNSVSNTSTFPEVLKQKLLAKLDTVYTGLVTSMSPLLVDLGAEWQRCVVHFYRKVWTAVPTGKVKEVAAMPQEDRQAAKETACQPSKFFVRFR